MGLIPGWGTEMPHATQRGKKKKKGNNKPIKINFGPVKRNSFKENKGGWWEEGSKRGDIYLHIYLPIYIYIYI